MPRLPAPTDLTARGIDAVTAAFSGRSREGALDPPSDPTNARPRRVVTFIGANRGSAPADALSFAQAIAPLRPQRSRPGGGREDSA